MKNKFKDHFSKQAGIYAKSRPTYPEALFGFLASLAMDHQLAWDCATGNGQAAVPLTKYFKKVIATDASKDQILQSFQHSRIKYRVATAEDSGLESNSVNLITVASGLHWFDLPKFYNEVNRILKFDGIIAAWTYTGSRINPPVDHITNHLFFKILKNYWPKENAMVWNHYRDVEFPFEEISFPDFDFTSEISFDNLILSLNSLSATQNYIMTKSNNPVDEVKRALENAWGDLSKEKKITRGFCMRVGKKSDKVIRGTSRSQFL